MSDASTVVLGNRYLLAERIGIGGYSEVWRAHDHVLGRPVAVKLLHARYVGQAETLTRFRAEARHAGSLSHENIARIYDYGDPDPQHPPFLVMELVEGPSLAEVLRRGEALDTTRSMDITAQTAAGLRAAHAAGLVHRDIKPANLLLSPAGVVKITDFGISHAVGSAPLTGTGQIMGTAGYFAPERASGARATQASDLYALGVVTYECLTGQPPFAGSALEMAIAHRDSPFPDLPATVPAEVAEFVRHLTAKDPADRPGNATEVADRARELRDRSRADQTGPARGYRGGQAASASRIRRGPATATTKQKLPPAWRLAGVWRERRLAVAAGSMALAAAAIGLALASVLGASHTPPASGTRPALSARPHTAFPAPAAQRRVDVDSSALRGMRVSAAVRQLRREGLNVRVRWRVTSAWPPGTVILISPGGELPIRSVVTIVGARPRVAPPPGVHGHGKPHGHGPGKPHKHGNGGNQGDD